MRKGKRNYSTLARICSQPFVFAVFLLLIGLHSNLLLDASAEILTQPLDSDGDGVFDSKEKQDGTDPDSPDSFIEHIDKTYCVDWNGFISQDMQVMELRSAGCSTLNLKLALRDSAGTLRDSLSYTLEPAKQFDLVVNTLNGFEPMTYGTLCATIQGGSPDTLDVRMSNYRLGENTFTRAFSAASTPARSGSQFIAYNNYFPTLNASEFSNNVEGWLQLSNEEYSDESGDLIYYDRDGTEIKRVGITIPAHGRFDVDTHSVGPNRVGLIKWLPEDSTKKIRLSSNRYYFVGAPGSSLAGVVSISARRPTGHVMAVPFQTDSRISVLEVSNTRNIGATVSLSVYDAEGNRTQTQPGSIYLRANSTSHVVLNNYLPSGSGKVQFSSNIPESLISLLLEYGLDNSLRFAFATVGEPKAGFGVTQRSSYNNFLGGCRLRLANLTDSQRSTQVDVNRYDGTMIPFESPVQVPANGVVELDLCSSDAQDSYGGVILTPDTAETLIGEVIRQNSDRTAEFKTTATERSICLAELRLNTSSLTLVAESGNPGTVSLTNLSNTVTVTNIQAVLPADWDDVVVDVSNCENLQPGASCTLSFTPGDTIRAASSVSIVSDNASELLPVVSVAASSTGVISITNSPLTLIASGGTGILTITNTSATATVLNVASDFTGTALEGNVAETGNTCATIAPSASCTLTFTPGSSVVAATNFSIKGDNTNTATASIVIGSGSTLTAISPNTGTSSGGTGITLSGTGLTGATAVTFNGVPATSVNVVNSTTVTAVTPAHAVGVVDVVIDTPAGGATLTNGYTYQMTTIGQSSGGGTIACLNGGFNNLIAAIVDNSIAIGWGGFGAFIMPGSQSNVDGASNTSAIVSMLGHHGGIPYAAGLCNDYEVDSQGNTPCQAGNTCYDDWFLPAGNNATVSGQLNCLYTNRLAIGGFAPDVYHSSTEDSVNPEFFVWGLSFSDGSQHSYFKLAQYRVRCVRAFTP